MNDSPATSCLIELHYLPCIRYLHVFFRHSKVVIEAHENYQKGSYRNRAYILSPQGKKILSVPLLKGKHQQTPVTEVRIAYHSPWYAQHWHAIQTAYGSAPFFSHYADDVRTILYHKHALLFDLNMAFLEWLIRKTYPPSLVTRTTQYAVTPPPDTTDLRNVITPRITHSVIRYPQVFEDTLGFTGDLSSLDVLMHLGPEAHAYLSLVQQ